MEETYEKKHSGTGLGLAITKQLVEAMGGEIAVDTKVNEGSNFNFSISFKEVRNYMAAQIEKKENDKHMLEECFKYTNNTNIKILVAEDNEVNRLLIDKLININKWSCKIARNGKEAIEILQKEDFDIILMDISMPVMNGIEAMKIIRSNDKWNKVPIIALTAHALIEDQEKFITLGMDDYLSKPIDSKKLYYTVLKNLNLLNETDDSKYINSGKKHDYGRMDKLQKLENVLDGDKKLVLELSEKLIDMFSPKEMKQIAYMAKSNDVKELKERIHKLKGAILNFQLTGIYELLNEIKICVESEEVDKVDAIVNEILGEIKEFKDAVMVYNSSMNVVDKKIL